jgi:hypothetical protein
VKSEVEENWKSFEEEREKWTGVICDILRHAGAVGNAPQEELESAIRVAKAEHAREFAAAKKAAFRSAEVAQNAALPRAFDSPPQKRAAPPDPFKRRMGELMRKHPGCSNGKIIGKYVGEGDGTPPVQWRKHNHREGDMLDAFACRFIPHPATYLNERRWEDAAAMQQKPIREGTPELEAQPWRNR